MNDGVALVTGGARGIGKEVARQLAADGMTVYIAARDPEAAQAAASELATAGDVRALAAELDVANPPDVEAAAALFRVDPGRLDVLINNAAAYVDCYGISKAALNALTSTLAAELADTRVIVNSICPGLTATWPGAENMGARPIGDGAASVVFGATLADDGPRGGFFRDGEPLDW